MKTDKLSLDTRLRLTGLQTLAKRHIRMLYEIEDAVMEITGERERGGFSGEFLWDEDLAVEWLWDRTKPLRLVSPEEEAEATL